jgi:hypothetical protein
VEKKVVRVFSGKLFKASAGIIWGFGPGKENPRQLH